MKNLIILLFAVLFLNSCGEDNPVNNGNPPPPVSNTDTLVYSLDSVSLYGTGSQMNAIYDSCGAILAGDSIKITFDISSNCTISDSAGFAIYLGSPFGYAFVITSNLNSAYAFNKKITTNFYQLIFGFQFNSSLPRFIKVSNIKMYKCS